MSVVGGGSASSSLEGSTTTPDARIERRTKIAQNIADSWSFSLLYLPIIRTAQTLIKLLPYILF